MWMEEWLTDDNDDDDDDGGGKDKGLDYKYLILLRKTVMRGLAIVHSKWYGGRWKEGT